VKPTELMIRNYRADFRLATLSCSLKANRLPPAFTHTQPRRFLMVGLMQIMIYMLAVYLVFKGVEIFQIAFMSTR